MPVYIRSTQCTCESCTASRGWPVRHLTGVCSSRYYVHIIPQIRAPCHDPPCSQSLAWERLSCCRETLLLVIWALRGWRCSQRSEWMDAHTSGKDAALAPAPRALSRWAEVLAPWLGPRWCCRPFAARSGSSYKLISLLTALCLHGPPVWLAWMEGVLTKRLGDGHWGFTIAHCTCHWGMERDCSRKQLYSVSLELLFRCGGKEASKGARAVPCFHFTVEKIRQHRISLIYAFILPTFIY